MAASPHITVEQFNALMRAQIPLSTFLGITALEVGAGSAVLRLPFTPAGLRPGGVQSGPALMALADLAMYAAVMGLYGNEPRVLSSDLSMNFLRRAPDHMTGAARRSRGSARSSSRPTPRWSRRGSGEGFRCGSTPEPSAPARRTRPS